MAHTERGPGRPPGPTRRTEETVLTAARRLFLDGGADALSFNAIAEETGVSRSTIYRHWPDRAALVAGMLDAAATPRLPASTSGDIATDLHAAMAALVERLAEEPVRELFAAVLSFGPTSRDVAAAGEAFTRALLSPVHDVVADAVNRGDLPGEADDLTSALVGPITHDHVLVGRPATAEAGRRTVERFIALHGIRNP